MYKPQFFHITDQDTTKQKEQQKELGVMSTAWPRDKINGDRQTRDVGRNERKGKMQGVDKMDTEVNSQEGKTGNLG